MKQRKRYYPYGGPGGLPPGVFDGYYKRFHDRLEYTREQAQEVAAWLNGDDMPLPTMTDRLMDLNDPQNVQLARGGRMQLRLGIHPLD